MPEFEEFIQSERARLTQRRDELNQQRKDIDRQLQEIEREFEAVNAYERVRKGSGAAASAAGSKRRTGIRQNVLSVVERHPNGISRADLLEEMNAKGDKRAEQSISNALSSLKKRGAVRLDQGAYTTG